MNKLVTIDCEYIKPQFAASFLRISAGPAGKMPKALFVENNTAHSVPLLLKTLKQEGLEPAQVEYLIITHVHFDHAGGTSVLMKACPNAVLLAHPKAAAHVIDPSKLVSSARKVYGDEIFDKLYGEIGPVDAKRVRAVEDGEELDFGSTKLRFFHTRGHALHHMCIVDTELSGVFTGDSFGLAYPALQKKGLFIFPSTSPTGFEPEEAIRSVVKIQHCGARKAWLTHFGEVTDLPGAATQLLMHLNFSSRLLERAIERGGSEPELAEFCRKELKIWFEKVLAERGILEGLTGVEEREIWELLRLDLELNGDGIAHSARRRI